MIVIDWGARTAITQGEVEGRRLQDGAHGGMRWSEQVEALPCGDPCACTGDAASTAVARPAAAANTPANAPSPPLPTFTPVVLRELGGMSAAQGGR
jgi:hypothetical protein